MEIYTFSGGPNDEDDDEVGEIRDIRDASLEITSSYKQRKLFRMSGWMPEKKESIAVGNRYEKMLEWNLQEKLEVERFSLFPLDSSKTVRKVDC